MNRQKTLAYGGQAVIEGVMMLGKHRVAVAVRAPNGQIVVHEETLNAALYRGPLSQIPFVRGLAMLWDALGIGTRALMWAAEIKAGQPDPQFNNPAMGMGVTAASLGLGVGLMFVTPAVASSWIERLLGIKGGFVANAIEGLIRLGIVVAYISAVGQLDEGKRLFAYHGAEHKTINAYEAGAPLTPESVQRFPLEHPRCGTAFLLTVVVINVLLSSLLGRPPFIWRVLSRLIMLPLVAGIAYEFIRFSAQHMDNPAIRAIVMPNLMMQRLTTREPDLRMLEVSICALERVLADEGTLVA